MSDQFIDLDVSPSRAASILELQDLRLVRSTWEMTGSPTTPPFTFNLMPKLGYSRADELVVFEVAYHFEVMRQEDITATVVEADVTYQIAYRLLAAAQLDDKDLSAFGNATVLLTVHPFLRELLRSFTSNSGLPPLVIPLLRTRFNPSTVDEPQPKQIGKTAKTSGAKAAKPPIKKTPTR
ncbi:MAG: hypothetical protein ACYDHP_14460 [Ferrimicrobium sp.]